MWLIEEAEERLGNNTQRFKVSTGETLAAIQSVSYCKHANIMAWNCTRFVPAISFIGDSPKTKFLSDFRSHACDGG